MSFSKIRRSTAAAMAGAIAAVLMTPALAAPADAADAATGSAATPLPATISADALPTTQIDGVAWAQLVVGNTVYVTGQFTSARPAGSAAGQNEVARSNILAYDVRTGELLSSWAPSLNGVGYALAASADGKTIYVGGSFTTVNGQTQYRLAALDAATGTLISGFRPAFDARVRSLAVVGGTVYAGGIFTKVGTQVRTRLAAVDGTSGALLPWTASADAEVMAMVVPTSTPELVIAGRFENVNGVQSRGTAAVDLTTGASLPWALSAQVYAYGANSAVYSLSTDGTAVYGTAYDYDRKGNFENSFAAEAAGGTFRWLNGCLGDTYSSFPLGGVLYTAGHEHDCASLDGGIPETTPRSYQYASAETTAVSDKVNRVNAYGWAEGKAAPTLLHWQPTFTVGTYTGQSQATWSVAGNSQYVVYGGEFPTVNGKAQQGLVRFAVKSVAPNKEGPQGVGDLTPTASTTYPGTVRLSWKSAWDRDDQTLTYELLRGPASNAVVVASITGSSEWWSRPTLALTDPAAPVGSQLYRVRVTDSNGNVVTGSATNVVVPAADRVNAYADVVRADGASNYWRLGDARGTVGISSLGENDLVLDATEVRAQTGALPDGDLATTFTGVTSVPLTDVKFGANYRAVVPATTTNAVAAPNTYSTEAWFQTTTTTGGKIIGFGNSKTDLSNNYDRQVYMTDDGRLVAGVYYGSVRTVSSAKSYNDGKWHHVVSTLGASGLTLYVDGVLVGSDASVTNATAYTGYWRIGGDNLNGWTAQPSSAGFVGTIDDVSVYTGELTGTQVRSHYAKGGGDLTPEASFTQTFSGSQVTFDGSSSTDDGPILSYAWDFGDGTTGTGANPVHQYATSAGYVVTLSVTDSTGHTGSISKTIVLPATDAYAKAVAASKPDFEYRFEETTGTTALDSSGNNDNGTLKNGATTTANGVIGRGLALDGTDDFVVTTAGRTKPTQYSTEMWVNTTTTRGGKLIGIGDSTDGNSGSNDRNVWMLDDGRLEMATWTGQGNTAITTGSYNDGKWHHVVFTQGTDGMKLYVDGAVVASNTATGAEAGTGYWRIGGDSTWGGASSHYLQGTLDEVAVYNHPLTAAEVTAHYTAGGGDLAPVASFTQTVTGSQVTFDGSSSTDDTPLTDYAWDFGDGTTGTGANPVHQYATSAGYVVTLTVTDRAGHKNSISKTILLPATDAYAKAVAASKPDFEYRFEETTGTTALDSSGNNDNGTLKNGATTTANGVIGRGLALDGTDDFVVTTAGRTKPTQYSTEMWVNTTTTRGGKLIGIGDSTDGNSGSNDRNVWMLDDGRLEMATWTGQGNTAITTGSYNDGKWHHVVFTQGTDGMKLYVDGAVVASNTATGAEAGTGYWRIGGDTTWGGASSHYLQGTLDEVAVYNHPLTAAEVTAHYTASGRAQANVAPTAAFTSTVTNLAATFDATTSTDPDGTITTWAWNFGDNTTATGATTNHTYTAAGTYTVTLVVTDNSGASTTIKHDVTVAPAPNVAPTAAFTSTVTNLAATFDATTSTDPDGTITTWAWNFGDNTTATGATTNHTYTAAGTYTVTLVVTDNSGASTTIKHDVTVAPAPNVAPTAAFTSTVTNLAATFDATTSTDPDGTITTWAWNFGDNTTATGATTNHTYTAAGTYTVTLVVTDNSGASTTIKHDVTVAPAPNVAPTAAFTSTVTNLAATFDATTSTDPDGTITTWAWNFGDNTTATGATTNHTYTAAGTYTVTLVVTDNSGASTTIKHDVTVAPAPNVAPTAAFTSTVTNLAATFDATTSTDPDGTITTWAWNFGDNITATGATTNHTYTAAGTYTVTLVVTDNSGATTSLTRSVTVTAPVVVPTPATTALATDAFGRTVSRGWGTADVGGAWTLNGSAANFSVVSGTGRIVLTGAGVSAGASLAGVSSVDTDTRATFSLDKAATGGGVYLSVLGRRVGTDDYRVTAKVQSDGRVALTLASTVSGVSTTLRTATVSGLVVGANQQVVVRLQVTGSGTTTVSAKAWLASSTEPSAWTITATDTAASLQAAGSIGVLGYLSASATTTPVTVSVSDVRATRP